MNPHQFIANLKIAVHDSAIQGVIHDLERPSGRKPPKGLRDLAVWYHSLSPDDRARVTQVVGHAVHSSLFGFLCVLDGVRSLSDGSDQPELRLQVLEAGQTSQLNAASGQMLHDLYQDEVHAEIFGGAAV